MTATTESAEVLAAAAARLSEAAKTGVPCAPVRDLIASDDVASAYAVQSLVIAEQIAAGATLVGRKIGLTSEAVQNALGVNTPDFGVLLDTMVYTEDQVVDHGSLLQPKVEAEIAFILKADLTEGPFTAETVAGAVDHARAALEIVDSRVSNWDITLADTVADNASSGAYVLGETKLSLDEFDPVAVKMSMATNGEVVSTGVGAACLGNPLTALAWLAEAAVTYGEPLRAGQVILSGALGPMAPVPAGAEVVATLTGFGTVTARFSGKDQA